MSWFKKSGDTDAHNSASSGGTELSRALRALRTALDLRCMVEKVTLDEFHRQEDRYEHDCSQGRELLFLIANQEWVRGTSAIITIDRADTIETEIKIDIDLRQITHGAFREKTGQLWLPVSVLPLLEKRRSLEPDPFATVTDAAGNLLPLMPADDMGNQMSAALAEIIVNMAIAHVPDMPGASAHDQPNDGQAVSLRVASRDRRVFLAAAIYHLLQRGSGQHDASVASASPVEGTLSPEKVVIKDFEKFRGNAEVVRKDTEAAFSKVRFTRAKTCYCVLLISI
jgi:hypothetical protein